MSDHSLATPARAQPASLSRDGFAAAVGAFLIWGLFPLYLVELKHISALEITAHRVAWSFLFVLAWMAARGELGKLREAAARPGVLLRLAFTALLVSINWLAFVWGVNHERTVEVSLGYYINPLFNVLLGIVVLSERLNRMQWIALALAVIGVTHLTIEAGHLPWTALTLAVSFSVYGFIRKTANVEALPGLAIEMTILAPLAIGFLIWAEGNGTGAFTHSAPWVEGLLVLSGVVTALPLYLFAYGARRLPYSTVGILQFIGPSLQLACAVFAFGEPFDQGRLLGFVLIWAALAVYAGDGLWRSRAAASA